MKQEIEFWRKEVSTLHRFKTNQGKSVVLLMKCKNDAAEYVVKPEKGTVTPVVPGGNTKFDENNLAYIGILLHILTDSEKVQHGDMWVDQDHRGELKFHDCSVSIGQTGGQRTDKYAYIRILTIKGRGPWKEGTIRANTEKAEEKTKWGPVEYSKKEEPKEEKEPPKPCAKAVWKHNTAFSLS